MKKKGKAVGGQKRAVNVTTDPVLAMQRAEAALDRGEVDLACQLLLPFKPAPDSQARDLAGRALPAQAFIRWDRPARALESLDRALQWVPETADLHRLRGSLLRRLGRQKAAVFALGEAERLGPQDPRIAFESMITRLAAGENVPSVPASIVAHDPALAGRAAALQAAKQGNPSGAEAAVAASPNPLDKLIGAVLLLARGQSARAILALEAVADSEQLPLIAKGYARFYLGVARALRRELITAAQAFESALTLNIPVQEVQPYLSWVYQQLAINAVIAGDLVNAAEWFGKLEKLGGPEARVAKENAAHALSLHGQQLAQEGNNRGALEAWTQALAWSPDDADLRQNLAILLEREDRPEEAIPHWQELIRRIAREVAGKGRRRADSQQAEKEESLGTHRLALAHRHLAELYLDEGEWERGVEQMERALRVLPSDADTQRELGRLLADDGQIRKAIPHFEQVVATNGSAIDIADLGMAYMAAGREEAGMGQLEKAYALDPEDNTIKLSLGVALATHTIRNPATVTARADAERAQSLLPERYADKALLALAAVLLALGDRKRAKQALSQANKKSADKASANLEIGLIYWRAGELEEAVKALATAMKKARQSPCLYADLAIAWAKIGDRDRCEESLVASLAHSEEEAVDAMELISKSREQQPLLRDVLNSMIVYTEDLVERVCLAEGLVYAGDVPGARSLLRDAAYRAVAENDPDAIDAIAGVDMKFNRSLIDPKTALVMLDWMDAHPGLLE